MTNISYTPSVYSLILLQARLNPHAIAVSHGNNNPTYAELIAAVEQVSRRMQTLGLPQGSCLAVQIGNAYLHWLVVIASCRLGLVSVSVPHTSDALGRLGLLQADLVLTDQTATELGHDSFVQIDHQWLSEETNTLPPVSEIKYKHDDPVRIVLSSGTTGTRKKVLLTHGQLANRLKCAAFLGYKSGTKAMSQVGIDTIGGFQVPLNTWALGGTVILGSPRQQLYETIVRYGVNYLFMAPVQLGSFVDSLPVDARPVPSLTINVAGSTLPLSISRKARLRITQSLFITYGSTETGSAAYCHAGFADSHSAASGYVLPWTEVQVVDASGHPVENGVLGEVRIRSAGTVTHYLSEPPTDGETRASADDTSDEAFRDGWFYPGDAGILDDTGMLSIVGRTRDLMNLGGQKIAPSRIEDALMSCPGVRDIAAFALGISGETAKPWVAVVRGDGFDQDVMMACYREKFPHLPAVRVANIDQIPRNAMGKVQRNEIRSLVERALSGGKNH